MTWNLCWNSLGAKWLNWLYFFLSSRVSDSILAHTITSPLLLPRGWGGKQKKRIAAEPSPNRRDNKSRCDGRTLPERVDVTVCWVFLVFISFTPCKLCSVVRGAVSSCVCVWVCVCVCRMCGGTACTWAPGYQTKCGCHGHRRLL